MATQLNEILHSPPILYPMEETKQLEIENGDAQKIDSTNISSSWQRYFSNLNGAVGQFFPTYTIQDSSGISQVALPVAPSLTQTQINNLQNVQNGTSVYNSTTNKMNFYENGAWVAV